jgi:hypothetical protein
MIQPSIGRIVWFQPIKAAEAPEQAQPNAAIVVHVWNDRMVNLAVFDANGVPQSRTSVKLLQDDDARPELGYFAEWMPYQKQAAAKA